MQYSIALPSTYDMSLIRARVEERSKLFETLPGLFHKSYLANEQEKIYAPFYLWYDLTEARRFMLNDLFRGVIQAFSRPRVRMWTVIEYAYGNKKMHPSFAVRETDSIPPEENLERMVERELKAQGELLKNENLHFHAIALDPDRWELMRYSLWKDEASAVMQAADVVQRYKVLHVSEPNPNGL